MDNIIKIKQIISNQYFDIPTNSIDSTKKLKEIAYTSIENLVDLHQDKFIDYLINNSRSGRFQQKLFHEFISLLENEIPFSFYKNKKRIIITSLLDANLNIFDGISKFDAIINNKLEVKNGTQELYIGGRKGSCVNRYYIGKILDIIDQNSNCLMENVLEYSFSKIKFKNIKPNTKISVSHLRVVPHYQAGAMNYINRARKSIIKEFYKI